MSATAVAQTSVVESGPGHLTVRGPLTFATARRAREEGLKLLASSGNAVEVDCSGVTVSDSAGLMVLLDWISNAKRAGKALKLVNLPEPILAVAKISNVEELLV
ncbi:MAG TPA: STAS domain-containing protein [Steroidobacteraceae bacterium]